jgi:hypothetical protein
MENDHTYGEYPASAHDGSTGEVRAPDATF